MYNIGLFKGRVQSRSTKNQERLQASEERKSKIWNYIMKNVPPILPWLKLRSDLQLFWSLNLWQNPQNWRLRYFYLPFVSSWITWENWCRSMFPKYQSNWKNLFFFKINIMKMTKIQNMKKKFCWGKREDTLVPYCRYPKTCCF